MWFTKKSEAKQTPSSASAARQPVGTIDLQLGRGSVADALPAPLWLSAFFPLAQQHFSAESQMAPSKMSVFPAESGKPDRSLVWRNWLIQGAVGAGTAAALCTTTVL